MTTVRVSLVLLTLVILALARPAQANDTRLFVESGSMRLYHHTSDCMRLNQPHRALCVIYSGKPAIVGFILPNQSNGCVVQIENIARHGVEYRVGLRNDPPKLTLRCTWHFSGNTLIVQPPVH